MPRARRGVALPLMLFALVVIASIAHAIVAPALASHRAARRILGRHAAESAVERTLAAMVGAWSLADWDSAAVDTTPHLRTIAGGVPVAALTIVTQVRPLSARVFAFTASASTPLLDADVAVRRSVLAERHTDTLTRVPALTAGGDIEFAADATIGGDAGCPEAPAAEAAIRTTPDARVTGVQDGAMILREAAAGDPSTYMHPGGLDVGRLAAAADATLPPGVLVSPAPASSGGQCVDGATNWGDPDAASPDDPCARRAPVIVSSGDLTIAGGEGQGALLVQGRLTIDGPFHYRGLIVATGGIRTEGAVSLSGAVFTGPGAPAWLGSGGAEIRASTCALAAAVERTARVRLVPRRWWWR